MSDVELIGYRYIMALGTPFPKGTVLNVNNKREKIDKYEFSLERGLIAVTDSGSKISDYDQIANAKRKLLIRKFFSSNENIKIYPKRIKARTDEAGDEEAVC